MLHHVTNRPALLQIPPPPSVPRYSPSLQAFRCPHSRSTPNRDRNSSTPMYAPHTRRFPSNPDRPCNTRWLSTLSTVPGVNCTQYSESALVSSACHARIASYLPQHISCAHLCSGTAYQDSTSPASKWSITLRSSLFHRTCTSSPLSSSCRSGGYPLGGLGRYSAVASPAACAGIGIRDKSSYAPGCSSFSNEAT